MIELRDSVVVLDHEFFAESGDVLPDDVDYDVLDEGVIDDSCILSDGEGGNAPAAY
ncbi:MAG: hypothetical protein OXI82_02395 [Nitrospinae bacterium]|nr:hypothetical protein [Nitrospinota bacterium]